MRQTGGSKMGSIEKTAKSKIDLIRDEIAERQKNFLKMS